MLKPLSLSVETVRQHVRFLEGVHKDADINSGMALYADRKVLSAAVERYERLWLPLVAAHWHSGQSLEPPVDIAWVWHLHRLAPLKYASYCTERFGRVLDPGASAFRFQSSNVAPGQGNDASSVHTRELWTDMHEGAPFFLDRYDAGTSHPSESCLVDDVVATSARQVGIQHQRTGGHRRPQYF